MEFIWGKIIKFGFRGAQVDDRGPPTNKEGLQRVHARAP